jgi:hypothetical protein
MPAQSDRLRTLYDTTLQPRLRELDPLRRQVRWLNLKLSAFIAIPAVAATFAVGWWFPAAAEAGLFVGFGVGLVALFVVVSRYGSAAIVAKKNYQVRFKRQVVAEIFKQVVPGASYEPFTGLDRQVVDASGLFEDRGEHVSDDRVRGRIGGTPFEAAEVKRTYRAGKEGLRLVFHGLFMQLAVGTAIRGTTLVDATSARNVRIGDRAGLQALDVDHAAFAREFRVFTDDDAEARTLVTPALMERLLDLRARIGHPVFLSFRGGRVCIAIHHRRALFEPSVIRAVSFATIERMADEFALAELVVQQLAVNEGTSTDAIDDSMLRAPDAPRPDEQTEAMTSGMLTEAQYDRLEDDAVRKLRADIQRDPSE